MGIISGRESMWVEEGYPICEGRLCPNWWKKFCKDPSTVLRVVCCFWGGKLLAIGYTMGLGSEVNFWGMGSLFNPCLDKCWTGILALGRWGKGCCFGRTSCKAGLITGSWVCTRGSGGREKNDVFEGMGSAIFVLLEKCLPESNGTGKTLVFEWIGMGPTVGIEKPVPKFGKTVVFPNCIELNIGIPIFSLFKGGSIFNKSEIKVINDKLAAVCTYPLDLGF